MSSLSRNIFADFGELDDKKNESITMRNTLSQDKRGSSQWEEERVNLRPAEDSNETGLRRSNRSNKGIAKEMFDPSYTPTVSRKVIPVQSKPSPKPKDDKPDSVATKTLKSKVVPKKKKETSEEESDSESESENCSDPKKLWCICKKPHGGRFMISCDVCEEWFHGDCVGITVQRGKQMEKKGEEYVCPSCIKKTEKKQKSSNKPQVKQEAKPKSGVKLKGYAHGNNDEKVEKSIDKKDIETPVKTRTCIVATCNNKAQPDSIYCSNVCILRHAKESLGGIDKLTKLTKVEKSSGKQETKDERILRKIKEASSRGKVAVMCLKTGKIFANASAPLKEELESFLQKNPTFQRLKLPKSVKQSLLAKEQQKQQQQKESVKSKSTKGSTNNEKQKPLKPSAPVVKTSDDPDYNPEKQFSNPYKQYTPISPRAGSDGKAKKHKLHQDPGEAKKSKYKSSESDRRHSTDKGMAMKISSKREGRSASDEKSSSKKDSRNEKEVRKSVQKTLQGILQGRSNNSDDLKMHPDSINRLVAKVEDSLYKLFGGVNSKYKNRYRSIMFNLKDEKNEGLWRKVILGEVTSARLVKMTAEEMASKELAQWRKHELTQELEMIQELEVANQTIRPVAKITHKGEIAINEDFSDLTESHLDTSNEKSAPSIAPQRIRRISATQPEALPDVSPLPLDTTSQHNNHLFDLNCLICTGQMKEEDANLEDPANKTVRRSTSIILSNEAQAPVENETDEDIIKKINAFSKKNENTNEQSLNDENQDGEEDNAPESPQESDSTAAIAMPEPDKRKFRKPSWENFLWTGVISMPELSNFRSNAYAVSGNSKELVNCIPQKLAMDGRIHPKVVWDYLSKVRSFSNKEVCVIQFHAASEEDRVGYVSMLSYFSSRKRFGVVSNQNTQVVKDIYIAPLLENESIPRQLLPLRGPGIPSDHPSMLIGIIVRCVVETKKSVIDIDSRFARISGIEKNPRKRKISDEIVSDKEVLQALLSSSKDDAPYSPEDDIMKDTEEDEEYNPETANFDDILDVDVEKPAVDDTAEDDDEAYDPEKVVFDEPISSQENEEDTPYDPEEDAERLENSEVKALQEKQAYLEKMKQELEKKKAELAKEEISLQKQQVPAIITKPKKTVSQTLADPRVAARMHNKNKSPPRTSSNDDGNPLQTIFSVLNMDRSGSV